MECRISAFLPVFNEEKRIKYALQSLKWCDEIYVLDKSSTDNTVEICRSYGATINIIPYTSTYSTNEFDYLKCCKGDWIFLFTASDIVDYSLGLEIRKIINTLPDDVGYIRIPIKHYVLGFTGKKSPWNLKYRTGLFRKSHYTLTKEVHAPIIFSGKVYSVDSSKGYIYHLTHVNVDMMMERHIRYWRGEAASYQEQDLKPAFMTVLRTIKNLLKRRTFFCGWDYVALGFANLSYAMMAFVYKWEKNNNHASDIYKSIREENYKKWGDYIMS